MWKLQLKKSPYVLDNIRIFGGVVFLIPAVDVDLSSLVHVDLSPLSIVLPLAGKFSIPEPFRDLPDALRRVRQHRLQGNS